VPHDHLISQNQDDDDAYKPVLYPPDNERKTAWMILKRGTQIALGGLLLLPFNRQIGLFVIIYFSGAALLAKAHINWPQEPVKKPGTLKFVPLFIGLMMITYGFLVAGITFLSGDILFYGSMCFIGSVLLIAAIDRMHPYAPEAPRIRPMPHGDAHFATLQEILAHDLVCIPPGWQPQSIKGNAHAS